MGKGMKWRTDATRKKMRRQGTQPAKDEGGPQSRRSFRVLRQPGEPCPRCGLPTQFRERTRMTEKQLSQPYYFTAYYMCKNPKCRVTFIMSERFKVVNQSAAEGLNFRN